MNSIKIPGLKCLQINVQHSRAATSNLVNMIKKTNTDIAFVQEPYTVNNKNTEIL